MSAKRPEQEPTMYVRYEAYVDRTAHPQRFVDQTIVVLPEGVDASDPRYVDFVDSRGLSSRELRGAYFPMNRGGRHILHADIPLIEGALSPQDREVLAASLGAMVVVLGEDPYASQQGVA